MLPRWWRIALTVFHSSGLTHCLNIFISPSMVLVLCITPHVLFPGCLSYPHRHSTETSNQLPQSSPCRSPIISPRPYAATLSRRFDNPCRPLAKAENQLSQVHLDVGRHSSSCTTWIYSVFPLPLFFSLISPPSQITENKKNATLVLTAPM